MTEPIKYEEGTPRSGYVTAHESREPRRCGNCKWFQCKSCSNPLVLEDEEVPDNDDGTKKVDADDCCNGYDSIEFEDTYANCLNRLLANCIVLRDLYRKSHWQVTGPDFYQLHTLFDEHYKKQDELVDMLAERIQSLEIVCVATATDTIKYATIEQAPWKPDCTEHMLCRLYR
jgi:hypothetical protein